MTDPQVTANLRSRPAATRNPTAVDLAARAVGTSPRSVWSAVKVSRQGIPELDLAVRTDQLSVSCAAKIADADPDEQRRILALPTRKERIAAANEIARQVKEARVDSLTDEEFEDHANRNADQLIRVIGNAAFDYAHFVTGDHRKRLRTVIDTLLTVLDDSYRRDS